MWERKIFLSSLWSLMHLISNLRMENFHSSKGTDCKSIKWRGLPCWGKIEMENKQNYWHIFSRETWTRKFQLLSGKNNGKVSFLPVVSDPGQLCWRRDMWRVRSEFVESRPVTAQHNRSSHDLWCCRLSALHLPIEFGRLGNHLRRQLTHQWFRHQAGRFPTWQSVYTTNLLMICIHR